MLVVHLNLLVDMLVPESLCLVCWYLNLPVGMLIPESLWQKQRGSLSPELEEHLSGSSLGERPPPTKPEMVKNQESRIKNQESRIKDQKSRVKDQESKYLGSRMKDEKLMIQYQTQVLWSTPRQQSQIWAISNMLINVQDDLVEEDVDDNDNEDDDDGQVEASYNYTIRATECCLLFIRRCCG